jgi:hypothetical protein
MWRFLCWTLLLGLVSCLDLRPPKVRFVSPKEGEAICFRTRVEIEAEDANLDRVDLSLDGNKIKTYTDGHVVDSIDVTLAPHVLHAEAYDKDGNHSGTDVHITAPRGRCVTSSAEWPQRSGHASVAFNNKLWVLGGYSGTRYRNDVWYSDDGVSWFCATDSASWTPRAYHASAVFDNKLWVLGGYDGVINHYDVWNSGDGINWTRVAANVVGWGSETRRTGVVFDNKLWMVGYTPQDVWYSSDGVTWVQASGSADWSRRDDHATVVFDSKLWVLGGFDGDEYRNDVWYSADGHHWTEATYSAGWPGRWRLSSVALDDRIWVLGGGHNDLWYSSDGVYWECATDSASWASRELQSSVELGGKLWLLGGYLYESHQSGNDVWCWP